MIQHQTILESKYDEIEYLLEAFGGSLTLTDILNQDIPILNGIRDARIRRTIAMNKKQKDSNK